MKSVHIFFCQLNINNISWTLKFMAIKWYNVKFNCNENWLSNWAQILNCSFYPIPEYYWWASKFFCYGRVMPHFFPITLFYCLIQNDSVAFLTHTQKKKKKCFLLPSVTFFLPPLSSLKLQIFSPLHVMHSNSSASWWGPVTNRIQPWHQQLQSTLPNISDGNGLAP